MVDSGSADDQLTIDWDSLLENIPDGLNFDFGVQPIGDGFSNSQDSRCSIFIDDIEQYLLNDESNFHEEKNQIVIEDGFSSDVLLDSSLMSGSYRGKDSSTSPESMEVGTDRERKEEDKPHENRADIPQTKENIGAFDAVDGEDDDDNPIAEKRKRQMRNRDAAVRSRERKKMYVRDLEMKSKYYEAECKRLGILLQCCVAENQALRFSLHNTQAFDASMTKQESAVLLLESLLLGSLLGFLGIIYPLILPSQLLTTPEVALLKNTDPVERGSVAQRKAGSEIFKVSFQSNMMCKKFKASRSRMKLMLFTTDIAV